MKNNDAGREDLPPSGIFFDLVILNEAASRAEGSHWLAAAKHRDQILRRRRSTRRGLREATSRFAHKRRGRSFSPPKLRFGGGLGKATSLRMTVNEKEAPISPQKGDPHRSKCFGGEKEVPACVRALG